jgi:NADH-quinone oxidoreductase subunit G
MADLVNLTIDDKKIAVVKGTLIVEAADSAGIAIPVFCYHPKMKPVGACRMCLVEVGGPKRNPDGTFATNADGTPVIAMMPKLQTACTTPVSEGMVVKTSSATVIKAQKGILEFLLINHPLDCPVCDKGGECPLQDQTFRYGPGASRFAPQDKQHFTKPIDLSERIALDRERCIMCFRCVRFQEEIAGDPQIDVFERGARAEIAVASGQAFDSNFSGNTIEICPVGALTSKEFRFRARAWEMTNVPSVCSLCAVGCNLTLQVRSNKVLRILARDNEEVNEVWICDRGRFDYEYLNENRLTAPLLRQGDSLEKVSWPQAQDAVVASLRQVVKEHGAQAVGGIASPRLTNEDLYLFQKFMRAVVGSNNVDYRVSGEAVDGASLKAAIADLEQAQGLFVIGSDVFAELPILGLRLRKAAVHKQAKLVVAYPQPVKLTKDAAAWLQHAPGQELALVQALVASLRGEPSSSLCDQAGLPCAQIDTAAKLLAGRTPSRILYGERLAEGAQGSGLLAALADLATALGATLHGLAVEANAQGARAMGAIPSMLPGGRPASDAAGRQDIAALWGVASLPDTPGLTGAQMLQAAASGALKALYVAGADALAGADGEQVEHALKNLDVLIVQDIAPTAASGMATVVLPAYSVAECEGTYTNVEQRLQRLRCALQPDGEMRAGWRIVAELAARMGSPAWSYASAADVFAEITKAAPAYAGLTYAVLGTTGARLP